MFNLFRERLRSLFYALRSWGQPRVGEFSAVSYSQEGEDMILKRIFEGQVSGFYVDVGAHHPLRFSNTYFFYKQGWQGINIDAMPGSMKLFDRLRPRDINVEAAISGKAEVLTYRAFNDPAVNGFSSEKFRSYTVPQRYWEVFSREMKTQTLAVVLDQHLPEGQPIDFLSIDVEGMDGAVLRSNNWKKYRPKVILVELHPSDQQTLRHKEILDSLSDMETLRQSEIFQLLVGQGYHFISKTVHTAFFIQLTESPVCKSAEECASGTGVSRDFDST